MSLDAARARFRHELGLPEHGRIVMTGHQCSLWHAGILAKYVACDRMVGPEASPGWGLRHDGAELAGTFDHAAWLWVDQDSDETHTARVPVRANGQLESREWRLKPVPREDVAAASLPAFAAAPFTGGEPALASVRDGIGAAINALRKHESEANAARQMAAALTDLMSRHLRGAPSAQVFATDLMRTTLGRMLIARIRDDPRGCIECYNRAVLAVPEAKVATLAIGEGGGGVELPLWWLGAGTARRRAYAGDLRDEAAERGTLAPRALLMTGMVRLAACDLFIHGTGGGVYDAVTESWFRDWLGVSLAPTLVVTADLLLPLHAREVTEADVARAKWRAHRARHDPLMLGDGAGAERKSRLVEAIRGARARGEDPLPHYRAMHDALADFREASGERIKAIEREAEENEREFMEREIATDRTWPFVFHDGATIRAMTPRVLTPR